MKPAIILINPWIYDFAAFDLWSKPLGLLFIAGYLRKHGFRIHLIDCLSRHHPDTKEDRRQESPHRHAFGTGKFNREQVPKPPPFRHVTRPFSRYGIPRALKENPNQPDAWRGLGASLYLQGQGGFGIVHIHHGTGM